VTSWAEAVAAAGHEVHIAGRDAPQLPLSEEGERVHRLPGEGPPLVRSLRISRALGRVAADVSPDLVHAHWLPEYGWMAAREGLRPLICSAWGSDVLGARGLGRLRSRRALEGARLVMADSDHLARAIRALADARVEVVRWGLDLSAFAPGDASAAREALGLDHEGPLVASMRGFAKVYNTPLVLGAFARVRERRPDARLLLKGADGPVPADLKQALERLAIRDAVTMMGSVPRERMPDVYRAADVVLSIASSDSSPRSAWEALACGRPAVLSDLPWAREELEPERHALLVSLDEDAVGSAVLRILEDAELAARLGKDGRALAAAELDPAACTARIDALYRSTVEDSR
jgi:glycosyltransferase involved in cell wall biosynthesis